MAQQYGLTAEMYRAVVAIVDDRMREIRVVRKDFDRLVEAQARTETQVRALAEAQARMAEAQARMAEAQARTEAQVRELAEAQARTEEEFRRYREESEARWARIEEAQARTEEEFRRYREESEARWARIETNLDRLAEAQAQTEAQIRALAEAQAQTEAQIRALAEAQARTEIQMQKLTDRQGAFQGRLLELTYQQKAGVYFGPLLRRPRALLPADIEDKVESHLSREEFLDFLAADLLVSGYPRHLPEAPQVWLVVEVSATVDRHDVERARRRAALLRQAGLRAIPAVAGEDATMGARDEAEAHKVLMLQDGRALFWEEALADALSEKPSESPE